MILSIEVNLVDLEGMDSMLILTFHFCQKPKMVLEYVTYLPIQDLQLVIKKDFVVDGGVLIGQSLV